MLGKVAKVSITPAALQPTGPKTSSRLALVKEKDPPAPDLELDPEPNLNRCISWSGSAMPSLAASGFVINVQT